MGTTMEIGIFLAYSVGLLLIYIFGKVLVMPARVIGRLVFNSVVGGAVILAVNFAGRSGDISIPLNLLSAVIVGFLGIPGALMLMLLNL